MQEFAPDKFLKRVFSLPCNEQIEIAVSSAAEEGKPAPASASCYPAQYGNGKAPIHAPYKWILKED